jgi:hypothetical protein
MSRRGKLLILGALIAVAAAAAFALGGSDSGGRASASPSPTLRVLRPELRPMAPGEGRAGSLRLAKAKPAKAPTIKDLITTSPVTVPAGGNTVIALSCGRKQGIALDGGVITPPPIGQLVVSMISRASPNPPFAQTNRGDFIGVRNLDPNAAGSFRGSLVCAKGISVR